jgi:hypothetical protein
MNKTIERVYHILEMEYGFLEYEVFVLLLVFLAELFIHYLYFFVRYLLGCLVGYFRKPNFSESEELLNSPA